MESDALGALAEQGARSLGRFRALARLLHDGLLGRGFELLGAGVGFCVASYTGVLLTASHPPFWSDTRLLGLGTMLACQSPEDGRSRGGGPGADIGSTPAKVTPDSTIFRAPVTP